MRTEKALKNSLASVLGYGIVFVIGLLVRRLLLHNIDISNLGYDGLFTNIFQLLSVTELGIGSVLSYHLYEAVAKNNKNEIIVLMKIYKSFYILVAGLVFVIGMAIFPFLPKIIENSSVTNWEYVNRIYFIHLFITVITFLLSYRRTLLVAYQMEYKAIKFETICSASAHIFKAAAIIITKDYIVYLLAGILFGVISNIIVYVICGVEYPFIKASDNKVTIKNISARGIFQEIKNFMAQKISFTIWAGTDNILISMFLGIKEVAFFSNYALIYSGVDKVLVKILQPLTASIGNMMYTESKEKKIQFFNVFDLAFFFISSIAVICYITLFQDAITVMFGHEFLLPRAFAVLYGINCYCGLRQKSVTMFRDTVGNYEIDKNYQIASAVTNIIISIIGIKIWGISGIMLGTVLSHFLIWFGRSMVVIKHQFDSNLLKYWYKQLLQIILVIIETILVLLITYTFKVNFINLFVKLTVCIIVPTVINSLVYMRSNLFVMCIDYVFRILNLCIWKEEK